MINKETSYLSKIGTENRYVVSLMPLSIQQQQQKGQTNRPGFNVTPVNIQGLPLKGRKVGIRVDIMKNVAVVDVHLHPVKTVRPSPSGRAPAVKDFPVMF
jgi:hypothetical protein